MIFFLDNYRFAGRKTNVCSRAFISNYAAIYRKSCGKICESKTKAKFSVHITILLLEEL